MRIVAFCGLAEAGKSTAASFLVREHGFNLFSFAKPIKDMMKTYYKGLGFNEDVIHEKLYGSLKNTPCPGLCMQTPRYAMQTLGTEWGRNMVHNDLWVMAARFKFNDHIRRGESLVIDDLRFENEAKTVRSLDGTILHIDRLDQGVRIDPHASENLGPLMPYVAATVTNGGKYLNRFHEAIKAAANV